MNQDPVCAERPLEISVLVTRACPFECGYCAQWHAPGRIAREDLRRAVELLLQEEGILQLQFFGGEPLLEYDLVRETVRESSELARQRGRTLRHLVATSLLPLTPERARELAGMGVSFLASLDGLPETHQRQRPTRAGEANYPWQRLLSHLEGLMESGAPYLVNLMIRPESARALAENVSFLSARGISRLQMSWAYGVLWPAERLEEMKQGLSEAQRICDDRGVQVLNRSNRSEPTILSGQPVVDSDGVMGFGNWPVLERLLPRLKSLAARGHVRSLERFPMEQRTHRDQKELLLAAADSAERRRLLLNNMKVGFEMARYWSDSASRARPGGEALR